jgi:c-di-GMP-binding flagellar brake protein YcgR
MEFLARQREAIDMSLGGARIYSDLPFRIGELMKLEIFAAETTGVTYTAEVVWIEKLPPGAAAAFDVGLKFIQLEPAAVRELMKVLGPPEDEDTK